MENIIGESEKNGSVIKSRSKTEWYLALATLLILAVAWWTGKENRASTQSQKIEAFYPDSLYRIMPADQNIWLLQTQRQQDTLFLAAGKAKGYAGPVKILVQYNQELKIQQLHIWSASETPSYLSKVLNQEFIQTFKGKDYDDGLKKLAQTDGVTGATTTCRAIAKATEKASGKIAQYTGHPFKATRNNIPVMGSKEIILLLLFTLSMITRLPRFRYKKQTRWLTLAAGLILLGFVYGQPLTLTNINSFLMGFWPQWQTQLYLYILILGMLLILLTTGKNPYCHHFCPFGAFQEVLGLLGKARPIHLKTRYLWIWLQRALAWIAVIIALLTHNPGISDYVVFGAAFQFTGSNLLFILLGLITATSLFIKKPWCSYLCPIRPIIDYIRLFRTKTLQLWTGRKHQQS